MKTPFETNEILMGLLMGNTSIKGGYYHEGDRPDNSTEEDIVVNTIDLTVDTLPQIGTSNVNIFVPDTSKKIRGKMMVLPNRLRLKQLANEVAAIIRESRIPGIKAVSGTMSIMGEPNTKQHFVNIRVDWNIQV